MKKIIVVLFAFFLLCSGSHATVLTLTSTVSYSCTGGTVYPFTFPLITTSDLKVILTTSAGVITQLIPTTEYTVACTLRDCSTGGSVTTLTAYAAGNTLDISRNEPLTQTSSFTDGMPTPYKNFERGLDKLTMLNQQQQDKIDNLQYARAYTGTGLASSSVTSLTVGTGSRSFTVASGLYFAKDMLITVSYLADTTIYMQGVITSYDTSTGAMVASITSTKGTGSYASWSVSLSGPAGAAGGLATATPPIYVSGGGDVSLKNNAGSPATVTAIDTGAIATTDTVIPTSAAVSTAIGASSPSIGQTVLSSALTSGLPSFITAGAGLVANIAATTTPIVISFSAGIGTTGPVNRLGVISADTTIPSLTDNATNYLYANRNSGTGAMTLGATPVKPIYRYVLSTSEIVYPPAYSTTYVKATTEYSASYHPWFSTDPSLSLTGANITNGWLSANGSPSSQRFHIDLGGQYIANKVYYENYHDSGGSLTPGANNFTLWGSNTASAFAELTYATDTNWTQITGLSQSTFDTHAAADAPDPKYITITGNVTPYRYYAFKIADNHGSANYVGLRRIEVQQLPTYQFIIPTMTMYDHTTGSPVVTQKVFIGEAVTSAGAVGSVVNYALRGQYDSGDIATSGATSKNHNIGVNFTVSTLFEGTAEARTQIMSKDFTAITHNAVTWSAVTGTSRIIVKRGF